MDQFTLLHFLSGIIWYIGFRSIPIINNIFVVTIVAIGWEIVEPYAKDWNPDIFPNPSKDSTKNKVFDVLAMVSGWLLAMVVLK